MQHHSNQSKITQHIKEALPGKRILKTVGAVFTSMVVLYAFGYTRPIYAILACILMMKETSKATIFIGRNRILGTIIGGVFAYFLLIFTLSNSISEDSLLFIFLMAFTILINMTACKLFKLDSYVYSMSSVVITITVLSHGSSNAAVLTYVFVRVAETIFGVVVAILFNWSK